MLEILHPSLLADHPFVGPKNRTLSAVVRRRVIPMGFIMLSIGAAMLYSLLWGPVVRHHSYWIAPGDLWATFRTAQFVSWGDIGDIYRSGGALVTLPGISVVLAPLALLIDHLGLSTAFPFGVAHPTAWLVLGPVEMLLGSVVLIPLDRLVEVLGGGRGARLLAGASGAAFLWPVLAIWGHPEDSLAMALALWGVLAAIDGRWRAVGWLFGFALVLQPLVVLMLPVIVALSPRQGWMKLLTRCALPAVGLLAIPLAQSWGPTTTALLKQPNYPTIDHATPWISLAPVLSKTHMVGLPRFGQQSVDGVTRFTAHIVHTVAGETVAAGPGRMIAIVLALALGVMAYRRKPNPEQLLWYCCVALSLRCLFEAVMNPYYLWPPVAIALVLVVRSHTRLAMTLVLGSFMTYWSYRHIGPWQWWLPVTACLVLIVVAAIPTRLAGHRLHALSPRRWSTLRRSFLDAAV